jgi:class 3 adenylate cyclase
MRSRGDGPPFRKHGGRVVYHRDDVAQWSEECASVRRTGPRRPSAKPLRKGGKEEKFKPKEGAERRQVTMMFSDLVGSTALAGRMDPEDLSEMRRRDRASLRSPILIGHLS